MRILCYNLYWKVFSDNGGDIYNRCMRNSENICMKNIKSIILEVGKEPNETYPNYDFMAFQEVAVKKIYQIDFPKRFIGNYNVECSYIGNNAISVFYKKKFNLIKKIHGNLTKTNDSRPFLILVFKENIIFITIHSPHYNFNRVLLKVFRELYKIPEYWDIKYNIIFCGDFNHTPDLNYINKIEKVRKFYNKPMHYTCCREKKNEKYFDRSDNIFTTYGNAIEYKTLSNPEKYNINNIPLMSDHLPIYCKVTF